jgi:quercetin dioxygenase-like cupin family protein
MKLIRLAKTESVDETRRTYFGGHITRKAVVTGDMGRSFSSAQVSFAPGARTRVNSHTADQIVIVTAGKGVLANEREEMSVGAGDIIFIPAGEKHWHGAARDSSFSQISVQLKESQTTWFGD